jgi:hypothetical protein
VLPDIAAPERVPPPRRGPESERASLPAIHLRRSIVSYPPVPPSGFHLKKDAPFTERAQAERAPEASTAWWQSQMQRCRSVGRTHPETKMQPAARASQSEPAGRDRKRLVGADVVPVPGSKTVKDVRWVACLRGRRTGPTKSLRLHGRGFTPRPDAAIIGHVLSALHGSVRSAWNGFPADSPAPQSHLATGRLDNGAVHPRRRPFDRRTCPEHRGLDGIAGGTLAKRRSPLKTAEQPPSRESSDTTSCSPRSMTCRMRSLPRSEGTE